MAIIECPSEQTLAEFSQGLLVSLHRKELADHARSCERCALLLTRLGARKDTVTQEVGAPVPHVEADLHPKGTRVGRFIIDGRLGEGGMGIVFLARDPELDRKVALKLLRSSGSGSDAALSGGRARLLREAQAMARLSHPNVVTLYEVGTHQDEVFIAMELVEGSTIKAWLNARPRRREEILAAFLEAGRGLEAAHAAGFVHRDFKPDNVLVSQDGRVRVTDFGLARAVGAPSEVPAAGSVETASPSLLSSPLTQAGSVVGTVVYMSPEQFAGKTVDARSDLFSFCVALYEALYGERPFGSPGSTQVKEAPPGVSVPTWLRAVLLRGLARDPDQRYPTMGALLSALAADPSARRRRVMGIASLPALALALAVAVAAIAGRRPATACDALAPKLASTWNGEVRQAIAAAFAASGDPDHHSRWQFAQKALERYANAWLEAGRAACDASLVAGAESQAGLSLRLDCLDARLRSFGVVTQLLSKADARLTDAAVAVVSGLPLTSSCADSRGLSVTQAPPPEHAAALESLRERLVRAEVRADIGERKTAIVELTEMAAQAQALAYPPIEAELLLALASAQATNGQFSEASGNYQRALEIAEANHLDSAAAIAATEILSGAALLGASVEKLDAMVEPTLRIIRRAGQSGVVQQKVEHALGVVYGVTGRAELALPHMRKAVELARQISGADSLLEASELNNVGAVSDTVGLYDQALSAWREALAIEERVVGRVRDGSSIVWANLALTTSKLGHFADAQAPARRVIDIASRRGDNIYTAMAQGVLANALLDAGQRAEGEAWMKKSLQLVRSLGMEASPDGAEVLRQAIEASLRLGQAKEGAALATLLLANEAPRLDAQSPDWVPSLRWAGAAFVAEGDFPRARSTLERALVLTEGHPLYPGWAAEMKFHLARALWQTPSDRARAKALAAQAEAELAALPLRKESHQQVVAWREKALAHP